MFDSVTEQTTCAIEWNDLYLMPILINWKISQLGTSLYSSWKHGNHGAGSGSGGQAGGWPVLAAVGGGDGGVPGQRVPASRQDGVRDAAVTCSIFIGLTSVCSSPSPQPNTMLPSTTRRPSTTPHQSQYFTITINYYYKIFCSAPPPQNGRERLTTKAMPMRE